MKAKSAGGKNVINLKSPQKTNNSKTVYKFNEAMEKAKQYNQ